MRWAGHVVRMGEERGVYRVLVPTRRTHYDLPKRRSIFTNLRGVALQNILIFVAKVCANQVSFAQLSTTFLPVH